MGTGPMIMTIPAANIAIATRYPLFDSLAKALSQLDTHRLAYISRF